MSSKKTIYYLIILISVLLLVAFIFYLRNNEKIKLKNHISVKKNADSSIPPDINKFGQSTQNATTSIAKNNNISITLNASGQDSEGGPLLFRAMVQGLDTGKCNLKLEGNSGNNSFDSQIIFQGTYYSCAFTIPFSSLISGIYKYTLTASGSSSSNYITGEVNIK